MSLQMQNLIEDNKTIYNGLRKSLRKKHRADKHLQFLSKCGNDNMLPKFTWIPKNVIERANLSKRDVQRRRFQKLQNTTNDTVLKLSTLIKTIIAHKLALISKIGADSTEILYQNAINFVNQKERENDRKRDCKLAKIIDKHKTMADIIEIYNETDIILPNNITKILEQGLDRPIGGSPNKMQISTKLDQMYAHWVKYAKSQNVGFFDIRHMKGVFFNVEQDLFKCFTKTNDIKILKKFLDEHPTIVIVPCDKSKNLCVLYTHEYKNELYRTFSDTSKFSEQRLDNLSKHYNKVNKLISPLKIVRNTKNEIIKGCVSKKTFNSIKPNEQVKKAYGIVKKHKGGKFRPIVSGINTVTSGLEQFLKSLLKNLISDCQFSVSSTQHYKSEFKKHKHKFNCDKHVLVSFDAVSLFTNVNVDRTINYVIDKLYNNPELLLQSETNYETGETVNLKLITKNQLKNMFLTVLRECNTFRAGDKIYSQKNGLVMGNSLSPILANIFCHMMEKEIILPKYDNEVVFYRRYVDDVIAIISKDQLYKIFSEMNNFDPNLKFTMEKANPNLVFLDTEIYLDDYSILQHKHFRKEISSTTLHNFKTAITPWKYLNSTLCCEIYRHNNTNSTNNDLDISLNNLKQQFLQNGYPEKLIDDKIKEIRERNFQPKPKNKDIKNVDWDAKFTLVLPYTSKRCSQVERKLLRVIKAVTPEYHVNFAWSLIKIGRIVTPRLKPLDCPKIKLCYKFTCECKQIYIGETSRTLSARVSQHEVDKKSAVYLHTLECPEYDAAYLLKCTTRPVPSNIQFLTNHFQILATNLNYIDRITYEAIEIEKYDNSKKLNRQKDFVKSLVLI